MAISKFNKTSVYFDVNTEGFQFCKLKELKEGQVYKLLGLFTRDGKFGTYPVFIVDGWLVDGTPSMTEVVKSILADSEAVADIKAGKAGIKMRTYTNQFGKQYGIDYVDI